MPEDLLFAGFPSVGEEMKGLKVTVVEVEVCLEQLLAFLRSKHSE